MLVNPLAQRLTHSITKAREMLTSIIVAVVQMRQTQILASGTALTAPLNQHFQISHPFNLFSACFTLCPTLLVHFSSSRMYQRESAAWPWLLDLSVAAFETEVMAVLLSVTALPPSSVTARAGSPWSAMTGSHPHTPHASCSNLFFASLKHSMDFLSWQSLKAPHLVRCYMVSLSCHLRFPHHSLWCGRKTGLCLWTC